MAERRGVDERHLRERRPARAAPQAGPGRRGPDRRHRPEVRMSLGRTVALTDTGRKRRHNEDVYVVDPPIFAIADGMGGANAGEVAAALAADALRETADGGSGEKAVVTLIQEANRRVYQQATEDTAKSGMGTTMTVALLDDGRVRIGHVGDSRAYLIRDGELSQLTDDHSLVGELVRSGKLTPEDAETHPQRSVITRALGPDVDVDTITIETRSGDLFLLCSDGLYSMVGNDRILELVERNRRDLDATAKALVAAANKGGGDDNITVVAFEIASPEDETATLEEAPAEPVREEEETLTEADQVPTVTVTPEETADPKPPRIVLALLAVLVLAAAASIVLYLLIR